MRGWVPAAARCSGLIAVTLCNTMCVYIEQENEQLSGTSWQSDEVPLGPLGVNRMTLEFLDNGKVEITLEMDTQLAADIDEPQETIIGHYEQDGVTATFSDITFSLHGIDVTFIEAHMNSTNTLFLLWRIEDILYPFTTALHTTR